MTAASSSEVITTTTTIIQNSVRQQPQQDADVDVKDPVLLSEEEIIRTTTPIQTTTTLLSFSIFDYCHNVMCGYGAAMMAVIGFGSFGVPVRYVGSQAHPMIMQSYKTFVCFITCWLILLCGEPFRWTYWGIVSGLFWVPGATWYVLSSYKKYKNQQHAQFET
jgi:hypothetical protein